MNSDSKVINICNDLNPQRVMVKTTKKSDCSWSAIFCVIVYSSKRCRSRYILSEEYSVATNFPQRARYNFTGYTDFKLFEKSRQRAFRKYMQEDLLLRNHFLEMSLDQFLIQPGDFGGNAHTGAR